MAEEKSVYQNLADRIFAPSPTIAGLFAMLADEQEAKMLLAMPATAPQLAERFSLALETMEAKLDEFFKKGLAFKSKKPEGVLFRMCRDMVQFHDATILWPEAPRAYFDLWQKFMEEEWPAYAKMAEQILPRPMTRIIPVEKSLSPRAQILAYENVRELIDKSDPIAVTKCTCRLIAHKCDGPVEVCLQVGKAAAYNLERGTGRQVSREEAMEIIRESEEAGLMHVTMNRSEDMHFICNCCGCCCIAMPVMIQHGTKMCDPSRYTAKVDPEVCEACGLCEERCWFSALTVDQEKGYCLVDVEKCMGCGVCQVTCPTGALTLEATRDETFIPAA
ncbi:MAG: 4Fe-4S binding protein [Proteobacteria bacterium]|nr:4Fe-4S binding protein [Pseudomonadota bacterium]